MDNFKRLKTWVEQEKRRYYLNRHSQEWLGHVLAEIARIEADDKNMGQYVYCKEHVGPHETGWCTVESDRKIALKATTHKGAYEEVKSMKLPIFGYCATCYKWLGEENCKEHEPNPL